MLNLQAYIEKERKIWLEKKRKKNLLWFGDGGELGFVSFNH
jgi:hypothetical protein